MVDNDPAQTTAQLRKVHELMAAEPELQVIPAHDERVQRELGYFPHWIE